MDFEWRNRDKNDDGPLLGYFAPWPCCTKCEDNGEVDQKGYTYTRGTSAVNFSGVGQCVPGFTAHECAKCGTWHIQVSSFSTPGQAFSMRVKTSLQEMKDRNARL